MTIAGSHSDPQRTPRQLFMAPRNDAVGCTTTTWSLLSPANRLFIEAVHCDSCRSHRWPACGPFEHSDRYDVGSSLCFSAGNMGLYHYAVCTMLPSGLNTVDIAWPHSDGEIAFFWQAEKGSRWSIARSLFMLVSSCTCSVNCIQVPLSRTVTSRSSYIPSTSTPASTDHWIIPYVWRNVDVLC